MTYRVLSPDRIDIAPRTYRTARAARLALVQWARGYQRQGYYRTANWRKIPLKELLDECEIIKD